MPVVVIAAGGPQARLRHVVLHPVTLLDGSPQLVGREPPQRASLPSPSPWPVELSRARARCRPRRGGLLLPLERPPRAGSPSTVPRRGLLPLLPLRHGSNT